MGWGMGGPRRGWSGPSSPVNALRALAAMLFWPSMEDASTEKTIAGWSKDDALVSGCLRGDPSEAGSS